MIGKIEFEHREAILEAILEDNGRWTCSDRLALQLLEIEAPPGPGWRPVGGQLHDGAKAMSGRVTQETKVRHDPDVAY